MSTAKAYAEHADKVQRMTALQLAQNVAKDIHKAQHGCDIPQTHLDAIQRAFYKVGPQKHMRLLKKAPSAMSDPLAFAAWNGLQPNPYKLSIGGCLFLDAEASTFVRDLSTVKWPASFDKDMSALRGLGLM